MNITAKSPWKHLGAAPYEVWKKRIVDAGGISDVAEKEVWGSLGDDSALALAMLRMESSYGSRFSAIPAWKKNYWNLQVAGVGLSFGSIREGAEAWRKRLYDPLYKQGIYAKTVTIADLIETYAPRSDGNDTDTYIRTVVDLINANGIAPTGTKPSDIPVAVPSTPPEPVAESEQTMSTYSYENGIEPDWMDYPVSDANKYAGWIAPKDHFIAACVLHSAYGSLEGSSQWFAGGNALTDCMVGNSYDGAKLDGVLRRFNDAYGSRYSWASGPVSSPIDDAAKFLEIFGPNKEAINMYTTALERSNPASGAPPVVSEKEHAKRVHWVAWHANRYGKRVKERTGKDGFTCDTFPLIPAENNRSFLIYHGEINADKRNTCPDAEVRRSLDRLIADVRTTLANWQKGTNVIPPQVPPEMMPEYAKPIIVPELEPYKDADTAPSWVDIGGKRFVFVGDRVRALRQTPRRQTANEHGDKVLGPPIEKGLEFGVNWLFWEKDNTAWFITPYWTRVKADDVVRVGDTP